MLRALLLLAVLFISMGARQTTPNFIVETQDPQLCHQLADYAERYRHDLAMLWLGQTMPDWSAPCVMTVQSGAHLGAGGATTFVFDKGEVYGWRMTIQGSPQRLLDSVLPHEITHMVFASYFRNPVPRWADEGGATSVEHDSEKAKHKTMLVQFLQTGRGIAFATMFAMTEYPQDVMPLYAQGYSLSEYLIQTGGRRKFVQFLAEGMKTNDWTAAIDRHYGMHDLGVLQNTWLGWVKQGSPRLTPPGGVPETQLATSGAPRPRPEPNLVLRVGKGGPMTAIGARPATDANGVPQKLLPAAAPATLPSAYAVRPQDPFVASQGSSPATSPQDPTVVRGQELVAPPVPTVVLSNSGWHAAGSAVQSPQPQEAISPQPAGPIREELSHPQPVVNGE
jgi:hypothetical protein